MCSHVVDPNHFYKRRNKNQYKKNQMNNGGLFIYLFIWWSTGPMRRKGTFILFFPSFSCVLLPVTACCVSFCFSNTTWTLYFHMNSDLYSYFPWCFHDWRRWTFLLKQRRRREVWTGRSSAVWFSPKPQTMRLDRTASYSPPCCIKRPGRDCPHFFIVSLFVWLFYFIFLRPHCTNVNVCSLESKRRILDTSLHSPFFHSVELVGFSPFILYRLKCPWDKI